MSMKVSARIYSLFLYRLVSCYNSCQPIYRISHQKVQQILQIIYSIICCHGNLYLQQPLPTHILSNINNNNNNNKNINTSIINNNNKSLLINMNMYTQANIVQNMFVFCNIFSRVIDSVPAQWRVSVCPSEIQREQRNPIRKHNMDIII